MTVEITVRVTAVDGRKVLFEVAVKDELDQVGAGTHTRFVVDKAKTFERLKAKAARVAALVGNVTTNGRARVRQAAKTIHVRSRRRDDGARRARGTAAPWPATDDRARLCQGSALSPEARRGRRAAGRTSRRSPTSCVSRSRPKQTCATISLSACSRCRREELVRLHASSGTTGKPTVVGYTRADLDLWADLMARSLACMGAQARRHLPQRLRLRTVHRRARLPLRRRAARPDHRADFGRRHRAPGHADAGLRRRGSLARRRPTRSTSPRLPTAWGSTCANFSLRYRRLRRRALERRHAQRHRSEIRHQGHGHLRPLRDHRSRRRQRMPSGAERPASLGGPFPLRGDRPRDHGAGAGRQRAASSSSRRSPRKRCR